MSGLCDKLIWFFANADPHQIVAPLLLPFAIAFGLYQSHYPWVLLRSLWYRAFGDGFVPFGADDAPALGMTVPTLLQTRGDLEGLQTTLRSIAACGYAGRLTAVVVIDGTDAAPALYEELRRFVGTLALPDRFRFRVTGSAERVGKAMAGDLGVQLIAKMAGRGELPSRPPIYFNVDADCELGPHALDRMVRALLRPSRLTGRPATIVTSHVSIREEEYFRGWRQLFTVRGWIAVTVAREYLVAIGLGRNNAFRVLPQNGASGALYCTWTDVIEAAPRWGRFLQTLRLRDYLLWWLGEPPPVFDPGAIEPLPEAMTGMGEDTWLSWLAVAARWDGDRLTMALPRTPAHAMWYALVGFVARPFRYDPRAKIYTTTPTTLRGLFRQRVRWNVSRIWTVQCWGLGLLYHLTIGIPAIIDVVLATAFQAIVVVGLVLAPFAGPTPAMAPALFLLVELGYFAERVVGTSIAMVADPDERGQWRKLLGLPFAGVFHIAFNVVTTIYGFGAQVFGHGYNDRFAPEKTLIAGGTSRIALAFRIRRFYSLALRSALYGDVPLGAFWLGWHSTPWTKNGYEGWSTVPAAPAAEPVAEPTAAPALFPVLAASTAAPTEIFDDEDAVDSEVRRRRGVAPPAEKRASVA